MLIEVIDTGEHHLMAWANEKALGRFGNGIIDKDVTQFIPAGDFVLQKIVESMMENLRKYDIIGRYGGEEFLLIMPEIDKENALLVTERMRQAISAKEIELPNGRRLRVTISLGVAMFDEDGDSPDVLLLKADERLYKAKRAGKNCSRISQATVYSLSSNPG